ncbi:PLP-dependent aminotransferase family protein [Streptomyces kaniharaensis]|uniref:PLP-dependent aminotransferase family protein n=1 Tax=Streptomyces kaniharaensis TaxID=212423 RepID=A0A6N7L413_9ACTN|nr:PLP-dependent aminotransferase family protein [Streptomyces kaniharaensis]MQS16623.1 PLP-dependent aminotransferase family protein [Streptomyces kaniharaensis]
METLLHTSALHASLEDDALNSMNFLNEIAQRFPDAISFAAGRPYEGFFDSGLVHDYLRRFEQYLREEKGYDEAQVRRTLFQYGRTKGIVHELIARHLELDEGIIVDPESVVVTVGCQEAMFLVLRALRADERDAVLAMSPSYVGLSGAARLVDMPVLEVAEGPDGVDLDRLEEAVLGARARGMRPRACYLVPDFSNPSGSQLSLANRHLLLDLAERLDLLLLEDNPYGYFGADGERLPTLKSLDTRGRVVYLGSFAKTGLPGARIGYAVADQRVATATGRVGLLADELSKIKSMLTVNTSPIAQAVIAGKLLTHDCNLYGANEREIALYRDNLRRLLAGLERHFPRDGGSGVSWNVPRGGFFTVLTVPFPADDALLEISARDHGVLWTPMSYFSSDPAAAHQLRLSYSQVTVEQIDQGLERLAALVTSRQPGSA